MAVRSPRLPKFRWFTVAGLAALAWTSPCGDVIGQDTPPQQGGQRGGGAPPGLEREKMWYAPTAEDWRKPCLIRWQRNWEDALALSKETGKPILVCTNMDGEIASEHYAGVRYRQPDKAKLYEPYVCVMASVYRHTPRDYDEHGRRIPCPRFGTVTCGEHIAIEPILYEQFFDGVRVAPRHICVELDGSETYDVYYAWDTDSVFQAIEDGAKGRTLPPPARGDRPLVERVASRDSADREAVEEAYLEGDRETREMLLEAAVQHADKEPTDLVRLAVFGLDAELGKVARQSLAQTQSVQSTDLLADALRVPMDAGERDQLIGALERLGEQSPKARTLAVVHRGLNSGSGSVDVGEWSQGLADVDPSATAMQAYEMEARLRSQNEVLAATDPDAQVALAEAFLDQAFEAQANAVDDRDKRYTQLLLRDADRTARSAESNGASGWRLDAVLALTSYYLGNGEEALTRSKRSVETLPGGETSFQAMAVLELFAKMRWLGIVEKVNGKEQWPAEWLTDVNSAFAVLARHPMGTDAQVAWHHDILTYLKAGGQAARVIEEGVLRFPESWQLHQRFRQQLLNDRGIEGLEPAYVTLLGRENAAPVLEWYAGFAAFVTAEFQRRRGEDDTARDAYERAIAHYEQYVTSTPEQAENTSTNIAMALAGIGRIALEHEQFEDAVEHIVASFERQPEAADDLDGMNLSAADTAKMLLSRLEETEQTELASRLRAAMDALDPVLLELPAYENPPDGIDGRPRRGNVDGQ